MVGLQGAWLLDNPEGGSTLQELDPPGKWLMPGSQNGQCGEMRIDIQSHCKHN